MTDKKKIVETQCRLAITRIDEAILKHKHGESADLSIEILEKVKIEIEGMLTYLDPKKYSPSYAKFILDSWEDKHGLIELLIEVSYNYKRIKT